MGHQGVKEPKRLDWPWIVWAAVVAFNVALFVWKVA